MSRIRGPYVRFCERDEAETPHPTRCSYLISLLESLICFYLLYTQKDSYDREITCLVVE